jgi:cytochrome c5
MRPQQAVPRGKTVIKSLKVLSIFGLSVLFSLVVQAQSDEERAAIEERIKPHGQVCVQGDTACGGAVVASDSGARSGEEIYNNACMACHTSGIAGAPKLASAADWADRLGKGMDVLYDSGINGLAGTGMIAKGGCVTCTDEEIKAAVDYMVDSTK